MPPGPDLIVRNQPWLRGIRAWDGAIVALGDARGGEGGLYRVEPLDRPERARAVPLAIPGAKSVVDIAMMGDTAVALVSTAGGLALAFHRGASWSIDAMPEPSRAPEEVILAAAPGALALLGPDRLHVLRAGSWTSVPVGPMPLPPELAPARASRHALLTADRLLIGLGAGEWGGALLSLDLAKGTWKTHPQIDAPIQDLAADPADGKPWVAAGLSHMGAVKGSLSRLDAPGWTTIAKIDGFHFIGKPSIHARLGWELPLASFEALAFDEQRRLHLLTAQLGVVRRDGARWKQLTPGWPEHVYVSGLAVRGSLLLIATFDAGVLIWDVETGKARRIALAGSSP